MQMPSIVCLAVATLFSSTGCSTRAEPPPSGEASTNTGAVPSWLLGVWSREWIRRQGKETSPFVVRYLQTPSAFGDVRLPVDRPKFPHANSFADLSDADLRALARQRGFVGHTTAVGANATWPPAATQTPPPGVIA